MVQRESHDLGIHFGVQQWKLRRYLLIMGGNSYQTQLAGDKELLNLIKCRYDWRIFEQLGVVEGVSVHGRGFGSRYSLKSLQTPNHSMLL